MPGVARCKKNANGSGTDARRRKDGRYETRATLDTPTGRSRVSFYGKTAEEANNAKFAALVDQTKGVLFSDPQWLTFSEYLGRWLSDTVRYQVSQGNYERYERTCRNHLLPFFGRLRLRDLTPAHVRAFKARKLDEGLHPNTVGGMQGVLSGALNQAVDEGLSRRTQPRGLRRPQPGASDACGPSSTSRLLAWSRSPSRRAPVTRPSSSLR
jgi:hypothetical protein